MPFDVLRTLRKPDQGIVQVVEAAGLLLGIQNTTEGREAESAVYRTVPAGSIYGPTLQVITQLPASEVLDRLRLLDTSSITDEVAHEVFAKTLQAGFAAAGNSSGLPGLAPPWASTTSCAFASGGRPAATHRNSLYPCSAEGSFGGSGSDETATGTGSTAILKMSSSASIVPGDRSEVDAAVHALKLAVLGVTRRLMDDVTRLPLQNRTMAVLIDGSRMSLLALELAGAVWKFGRFVVIHVGGEKHTGSTQIDNDDVDAINNVNASSGDGSAERRRSPGRGGGPECEEDASTLSRETDGEGIAASEGTSRGSSRQGREGACGDPGRPATGEGGRWEPGFLEAEIREACLRQLEIPEESLELVFRSLPPGSDGTVNEITKLIGATLDEYGVEVVFMGCYGRRGPRVTQFGAVAHWAMEHTSYQIVFAKKFSPSMVSTGFFNKPKRYLVAVTADLDKVSHMLDRLLPLVSPRDSVVLIHIVDECVEDTIAGEEVDVEQVKSDLLSLLSHKRGLCHRVRVEKTGRPPENPTQTVVQKIVKVAEEEGADFLAILHDESRGSYRTVATGCLSEARCGLIAIH